MNKTAKTVLTTLVLTLLLVGIVLVVLFGTGELIWAHSADKIPVSKYSLVFTSAFTQEEKEDFPAFLETGEQLFLTAEINFNIRVYEDKIILDKSDGDRGFVFGYDERVTFDLGGGSTYHDNYLFAYEGMTGSDGFDLLPATKEGCEFLGWNMAFHNKIGSPFAVTFTAVYSE